MATDLRTMNLSDNGDGMVPIDNNQGTSFVSNISPEKNVSENKQTMDSTSISDIMGQAEEPLDPPKSESKNPFNLTDDQFEALIVAVCAAAAISKPVQEKLANFVPSFLNDQGNRSAIGLASTGMVAAIAFYLARRYA